MLPQDYGTKDSPADTLSEKWWYGFRDHRVKMPAECQKQLLFRSLIKLNTLHDLEFPIAHHAVNRYIVH